jgi:hypothetical protein
MRACAQIKHYQLVHWYARVSSYVFHHRTHSRQHRLVVRPSVRRTWPYRCALCLVHVPRERVVRGRVRAQTHHISHSVARRDRRACAIARATETGGACCERALCAHAHCVRTQAQLRQGVRAGAVNAQPMAAVRVWCVIHVSHVSVCAQHLAAQSTRAPRATSPGPVLDARACLCLCMFLYVFVMPH